MNVKRLVMVMLVCLISVIGKAQNPLPMDEARLRLTKAISNPEYMLSGWVNLPTSTDQVTAKPLKLTLRNAILLSLRYNPNIQNAELDRIIQRYQLRLAYREFEWQYALAASGVVEQNRYQGVGSNQSNSALASPEIHVKNRYGGQFSLNLDNNVAAYGSYGPVLNASLIQPLLRGFGRNINEMNWLNAKDTEQLNQLGLKQSVMEQVTRVINDYRSLIVSGNTLESQKHQLEEARHAYDINEKKITAGQLEPSANVQQAYQIESLNLMVEQGENDFKVATMTLLASIGLSPTMQLSIPDNLTVNSASVPPLQSCIDRALSHNLAYLAQKQLVVADKRAYLVAKNEQLWQLDVGANLQSGVSNNVDGNGGLKGIYSGRNVMESARLTLTIPLDDVGRKNQLIRAKVQLEKDQINLKAAERMLITQVTNSVSTMQSLAKRLILAEKQVHLALQSYELEKKKQRAGISSALDVNNTQNQYLQAQAALIGAKVAYLNQRSALETILATTLDVWKIKVR